MAGWRRGDDNCIDVWQGILKVGVYGNAVIRLLFPVIDLGKLLVHANDRRYSGRRLQHTEVSRTPITYSDDADPNSVWPHPRITPLVLVLPPSGPRWFACFGALPISARNGIPA